MEQLNTNNKVSLVETNTESNAIILRFDDGITSRERQQLSTQMEEIVELLQLGLERNREEQRAGKEELQNEIKDVKKAIESKYISPEQLKALESLVDKKARKFVTDKKGIQLSIDVFLNYDREGLAKYQELVNEEVGKTKSKIWVELNKECLERKGTEPKNRIKNTQVEQAFDFVRTWGGLSV